MRTAGWCVLALAVSGITACGDNETNDRRGYTKAPLERPAVFIDAEQPTEMSRLGVPNRPRGDTLTAQPAQPTGS